MILIADGDVQAANALALVLIGHGYCTSVSTTYPEALELGALIHPRLIICELDLEGGDGCDLLCQLRWQVGIDGIVVTAHISPPRIERCLSSGFSTVLHKPVFEDQLLSAVAKSLGVVRPQ